ncbi:ABC transporter, transmembrane region, type 1 [Cordyceps fumosorosea ARSEF 2679]|uniref:ABC transporter, transmembrane region, type 1 n=1 Tax=Cordyceps fumosorosea (strain ARSEF 2679) TaxID=1081104 RepID=A0A168D6X5_CORFA|nr:ABC transporter, transmembrane region, type 1 [Cordyceps fumosorosea ARSEF 2679]OAA72237.1 ABC transporter, transmembrane region, type 1 [Cordyceps fumosorosea ARSEF 2679]
MQSNNSCTIDVERAFGPSVSSACLGGFDFTLLFEETILTILPLSLTCKFPTATPRPFLLSVGRALQLRDALAKVDKSWLLPVKMLSYGAYVILQIVLLALWAQPNAPKTTSTLAALSVTLVTSLFFLYLSYLEHTRSVRPSTLLTLYLGLSTLFDLARVRTLLYLQSADHLAAVFLAGFCVKVVIFLLELYEKRRLLRPKWRDSAPEATSSTYSRALFIWLNELMLKGFRSSLTVDTLTPIDADLLQASEPSSLLARWNKSDQTKKHALLRTFIKHYKWHILAAMPARLAYLAFTLAQPFLVQRVLDYVAAPPTESDKNTGYGLIAAYALVYIGIAISYAVYELKVYRAITLFRGSLISAIFDKTLRVSSHAASDAEAMTLMSADIDRIGESMEDVHELYAGPLELGLTLWLLYRFLGVAMSASTAFVIVCLVGSLRVATIAGDAQVPWLEAIETRLEATSGALGALKGIRMTGVNGAISAMITRLRQDEIRSSLRYRLWNIFLNAGFYVSSTFAPVWGFGVFILLARSRHTQTLTEQIIFPALTLYELSDQPTVNIPDALEHAQTILNCFERIQEYLVADEQGDSGNDSEEDGRVSSSHEQDGSSTASSQEKHASVKEKVQPAASLKADLANADAMFTARNATAAYSSEKGPILKALNFDLAKSKTTMIIGPVGCGKSTLLRLLLGEVPEVGGSLDRNFLSSAYCPQSSWIFRGTIRDNIVGLSTWDEPRYKSVVQACCLSADFDILPNGDRTEVGTRGSHISGGQQMRVSLARALFSGEDVIILDDVLAGVDRITESNILESVFGREGLLRQWNSTTILATSSVRHLRYSDSVIVLDRQGNITQQCTPEELSDVKLDLERSEDDESGDGEPELDLELPDEILEHLAAAEVEDVDGARRVGDIKIYAYFISVAGWWYMVLYVVLYSAFVFGLRFPAIWLQWWANANEKHPNENIGYWLGVYAAIAATAFLGSVASDSVFQLRIVPKMMVEFHNRLLSTTMHATTRFITSKDTGTILNRFSQDLNLIDSELPSALDKTIIAVLSALFSAVLVFIGSSYVGAAIPLCIGALYIIQLYYLRTSRQLRLLDIESKAPLFSLFVESIEGLASIRAYSWSRHYMQRSIDILNASQKPYYLMWCIQRWLTLVLNLVVAAVAILLVGLATNIRSGSTGFLGVALFNIVSFSQTLQLVVTEWTHLETAIGAVSRVRSFVLGTEREDAVGESEDLPSEWPKTGSITFTNVSASYEASLGPVLQDINLEIKSGERVAICGRTGSGKSSCVSSLFRMLDLDTGSIVIDGVNIAKAPREELRRRLNTVPQQPFFLYGSVRENIDPLGAATDERLVEVLTAVQLWDVFEEHGGLDEDMDADLLSHGQRQLFCLGRAMVRSGRILVLDEFSSSVDADTDDMMHRIIHDEFQGRTVIAIAHKLDAILDFDRVVFLDKGRIAEIGAPRELLAREGSLFRAQYESSGN